MEYYSIVKRGMLWRVTHRAELMNFRTIGQMRRREERLNSVQMWLQKFLEDAVIATENRLVVA